MSPESLIRTEASNVDVTAIGEFERQTEGYIVIMPLPDAVTSKIDSLQQEIAEQLPASGLWLPHGDQLHVTFAHVVSPDATYESDRDTLFEAARPAVESALTDVAPLLRGNTIVFDTIQAFPAAIILTGKDYGTMAMARQKYLEKVQLPDGSRLPPKIIHITLARFREQMNMADVEAAIAKLTPNILFTPERLELVQEHSMYTQSHTVIGQYHV